MVVVNSTDHRTGANAVAGDLSPMDSVARPNALNRGTATYSPGIYVVYPTSSVSCPGRLILLVYCAALNGGERCHGAILG